MYVCVKSINTVRVEYRRRLNDAKGGMNSYIHFNTLQHEHCERGNRLFVPLDKPD